ncbi:pentapeptide repeat-containing protein, partial [Nocardiopsis sp. frass1]
MPLPRLGRGLRSSKLPALIVLSWVAASTLICLLSLAAWWALDRPEWRPGEAIGPGQAGEILRMAFAVVAGLGGTALLVIAYKRQSGEEKRLFTERFTTAVGQLGEANVAVSLGGVHALAHLADDAPTPGLRQMCVDVLCAYLRIPKP